MRTITLWINVEGVMKSINKSLIAQDIYILGVKIRNTKKKERKASINMNKILDKIDTEVTRHNIDLTYRQGLSPIKSLMINAVQLECTNALHCRLRDCLKMVLLIFFYSQMRVRHPWTMFHYHRHRHWLYRLWHHCHPASSPYVRWYSAWYEYRC